MSQGWLFIIVVIVSFVVFATQAGRKGSFLEKPLAAFLFLIIMGSIVWAIMGTHMVVVK